MIVMKKIKKRKGNFLGHKHSRRDANKISVTLKKYYKTHVNGMKGRKASIKTRQKISAMVKKYHSDPVNKEKFRKAHLGKKHSEETKLKIRIARARQIIPFKDTKIEVTLQKELKRRKIKFRKHEPIIGLPDIFIEPNICIFADGDLYHAHPDKYKANEIVPIINIKAKKKWLHDKQITENLKASNYVVLRFWENEINKDLKSIGDRVEKLIKS